MGYTIMTDSTCNLPLSMLENEDITLVPLSYYAKEDTQVLLKTADIEAFDGTAYYDRLRTGHLYNTSQISPQEYYEAFLPYIQNGEDILFISISSGISGSYNSALQAKQMIEEQFPKARILVFDTLAASLGEGLQVLKALEFKKCGMALQDVYQKLMKLRNHVYQVFTVENLKHLQRTGRLSNAAAIIGTMLNIRPILKGNEKGLIVNIAKTRGSRNAIRALAEKYHSLVENAAEQIIGIAHADNPKGAEMLKDLLNEYDRPKDIITVCYEPVTGSHVGPDTLALFFFGGSEVRSM